jgi:undecaprenyl-phosphate galactose phosphotransferase
MKAAHAAIAKASSSTYIVLAADDSISAPMNQLFNEIKTSRRNIGVVPPLHGFGMYNNAPRYFFGHDVMIFHPSLGNRNPIGLVFKRSLDVLGSFFGLLALSPLFLTIALLIKWQSPASTVLFKHKRVGKGGKLFKVYKFTSMVPNAQQVLDKILAENPVARAEWERDFKLKDDPRILPVGKLLRATSLDELPQLWNVLKGHMSLVGPRPIVEEEKKYYGDLLPDYISIQPGLTGLWQISGRNDTSYEYRVYLDSWYARHWSFWHDVVILLETVKIVLKRSGAY